MGLGFRCRWLRPWRFESLRPHSLDIGGFRFLDGPTRVPRVPRAGTKLGARLTDLLTDEDRPDIARRAAYTSVMAVRASTIRLPPGAYELLRSAISAPAGA
jgi:hypothetical protein